MSKGNLHIIRIKPAREHLETYNDPDERRAREDRLRTRRFEQASKRKQKEST